MKIDIRKHAREIGRHLRNRKFELTPAGVMIDKGGMNALVNGVFIDTLNGGDPQVSPNLVVDQGLIHVLNTVFAATTPITAWYIGLYGAGASNSPAAGCAGDPPPESSISFLNRCISRAFSGAPRRMKLS